MLSSLANQAAIATENARLQARLRELAVVAERERIAREMHDGLAQVLGYVNTKSQADRGAARRRSDDGGARPPRGARRRRQVDLCRHPRGHPGPAQPGRPRDGAGGRGRGLRRALRRGVEDRCRRRGVRRRSTARPRARRRGPGLPRRPGGADQRAQALRGGAGRDRRRGPATAGSTWSSPTTARASSRSRSGRTCRTTASGPCANGPTASGRRSSGSARRPAAAGST